MPFGGVYGAGFVFGGKTHLVVGRTGGNHGQHVLALLGPNVGQHRAARGQNLGNQIVHPVRMLGAHPPLIPKDSGNFTKSGNVSEWRSA